MGKEKQTRCMELEVPTEAQTEVTEIIKENELKEARLGSGSEEGSISIGFDEDYKSGEEEVKKEEEESED